MPTYVVFLGPPGAGKGTQAKIVSKETGLPQVSTGDLFRAMKTQETELAKRVLKIMADGDLVPDDVTVQMVEERLSQPDCKDGALMDGFPRTTPQADAFDAMLTEKFGASVAVVPFMYISEDEAVRRISGRWSCLKCGTIYHDEFSPPQTKGICDSDGEELVQRADDKPAVVRDRSQVYDKNTSPLVEYYEEKGLLVRVDATRDINEITADLLKIIREKMEE